MALILAVDDMPDNLLLMEMMLGDNGHEIITALSGQDCLTILKTQAPNLILMDVNMPGMSGFDACKLIKANRLIEHIPVVFVTAQEDDSFRRMAEEVGGVGYFSKPVDMKELEALINLVFPGN